MHRAFRQVGCIVPGVDRLAAWRLEAKPEVKQEAARRYKGVLSLTERSSVLLSGPHTLCVCRGTLSSLRAEHRRNASDVDGADLAAPAKPVRCARADPEGIGNVIEREELGAFTFFHAVPFWGAHDTRKRLKHPPTREDLLCAGVMREGIKEKRKKPNRLILSGLNAVGGRGGIRTPGSTVRFTIVHYQRLAFS